MNIRDTRLYEMLLRLKEFGIAYAVLFPADSLGGRLFAAIATAVDAIGSHFAVQATKQRASRKCTSAKGAARQTLLRALDAVRRTSRAVVADTPGAVKAFRVSHRTGDQQLVAAARSILAAATPLHDQFVAHNLPATFVDDLTAAIGAFEQAIDAQSQAVESRAGARANISAAIADALTTVARLDPVVENRLKDDPGLLAEWRTARHVSRLAMPHPKGDRPGAPAAPPPAPATPPLG